MNRNIIGFTSMGIASLFAVVGCTTTNTSATYEQLQKSYTVVHGRILEVEEVTIDDSKNPHEGALVGAIAGAAIGGDERDATGALIGLVLGGVAGSMVDEWNKVTAWQLLIEKNNGEQIRVLQRKDDTGGFYPNQRVEVLTDPYGSTIVRKIS